ncbi:MAG: tetratricopeptide repeat protein [Sphingomonadales bacterium]|nr:MAG: tetratricopeptide repeat protein [Sphingomonadales bacterium]
MRRIGDGKPTQLFVIASDAETAHSIKCQINDAVEFRMEGRMRLPSIAMLVFLSSIRSADAASAQDLYNLATADYEASRCDAAVEKYQNLLNNSSVKSGTALDAVIKMRIGICKVRLQQPTVALPMIQSSMPILEAAGEQFKFDMTDGWISLGDVAFADYNYKSAAASYRKSLESLKGLDRLYVLAKLIKSTMFNKSGEAIEAAGEAIQIINNEPSVDKSKLASIYNLYGRALLNSEDLQKSYKYLKLALDMRGGLSYKTSLEDNTLRHDLAIVSWLLGNKKEAQSYLFYTGAGRIPEAPFVRATYLESPLCGDEDGLKSSDFAIVEFSINKDGSVASAHTVYTQGGRAAAEAFGRAASKWYWSPDQVEKIPAFYRLLTRVELRCSNRAGSGSNILQLFHDRFTKTALDVILKDFPDFDFNLNNKLILSENLLKIAKVAEQNKKAASEVAALSLWFDVNEGDLRKKINYTLGARQVNGNEIIDNIADKINYINMDKYIKNWIMFQYVTRAPFEHAVYTISKNRKYLERIIINDDIKDDPIALNTIYLLLAKYAGLGFVEQKNILNIVSQDERLSFAHPLRQSAFIMLADRALQDNNEKLAQEYYNKTGLTSGQCALISDPPKKTSGIFSYSGYPNSALYDGFEGWTIYELDVSVEGKPVNIRPTFAYPPFLFSDTQIKAIEQYRFEKLYRPESDIACTALSTSVRYTLRE